MGGVDLFDQMVASYRVLRKTRKWWKTLFFDFVDMAATNAFILDKMWCVQYPGFTEQHQALKHMEICEVLIRDLANIAKEEDIP